MMLELLNKLSQSGELKQLVQFGIVSTSVLNHYELYLEYNKRITIFTNKSKTNHIEEMADQFNFTVQHIYRIINKFESA